MSQGDQHPNGRLRPLNFHEAHDSREIVGCANCGAPTDGSDESDDAGRAVCSVRCQTQSNAALVAP